MPVLLLERFPWPSLRTYTSVSVLLLACVVLNSHRIVKQQEEDNRKDSNQKFDYPINSNNDVENAVQYRYSYESDGYFLDLCSAMLQETWCVWVLVNMAYCCLILFGKLIQKAVFGELRVAEQQQIKDKFWNFVFYKFIFVFGVMNVQTIEEVALWCAWFSVLGFLHLLSQLCNDRFEYLCSSPASSMWTHMRVLMLLGGIEFSCFCLLGICILVGLLFSGINTFAFMAAECILLVVKSLHVIVRYSIHLWDLSHEGNWENRALYVYYSELVFELSILSVDFMHHLHMLLWGNIFLSMASLVICMQLRFLFHEFQRRLKRHNNYLRVVNSVEANFPMAQSDDLQKNSDDCPICWEKLESARKLPCGHLFHNSCLRSWLEQDTTCPTCRQPLGDDRQPRQDVNAPGPVGDHPPEPPQPQLNQLHNHFFHFDGSRYVSWLPSFSVEVTHTALLGERNATAIIQNSQMDNMVRQVREVFPDVPEASIQEDLQRTRSVQITLENIIEGIVGVSPNAARNANGLQITPPNVTSSSQNPTLPLYNSSPESEAAVETLPSQSSSELNPQHLLHYNPGDSGDAQQYIQQQNSVLQSDHPRNESNQAAINSLFDDNLPVPSFLDNGGDISEESSGDSLHCSGSRFSKSSTEREIMLQQRKQSLIEAARRQYLSANSQLHTDSSGNESGTNAESNPGASASNSDTELKRRRRALAYEAAYRRLQNN